MDEQSQPRADNPYVGPRNFSEREQARFFGRQREADDLRSLVLSEQVVLFYAQSGAGKSSLVNARLHPDLRAAGFRLLPTARVSGALTASDVAGAANVFCLHLLIWLDENRHATHDLYHQSLTDYLIAAGFIAPRASPDNDDLEDELAEAYGVQSATPLLLVIDQFEELFTAHADKWEQRTAFFRQVRAALQAAPHLHLLLVMREDFVASLDPYLRWLPGRLQARYGMERLGPEAAEAAIAGPVAESAHPFAPDVAGQLVDNLRLIRVQGQSEPQPGQYVEPVQLQVVCWQLWENLRQRPPGPITADDLQGAGDVDRALADYYEQSLRHVQERLPGLVSETALRDWFSRRLITESGTRGLVNQGESHTGGLPNAVVGVLDSERYLVRHESRAGGVWCELTHDRFVQPILAANRAWETRQHNPLAIVARLWLENNRAPAWLLTGQQLRDAQAFANEQGDLLRQEERDFLAASTEAVRQAEMVQLQAAAAAQRRRTRNLWRVVMIVATLALLALLTAGWAFQQRSAAQQNANRAALAEAQAKIEAGIALRAKSTADVAKAEAEIQAVAAAAAQAKTQALSRFIRADQLAQTALVVDSQEQLPQLALLLAVESADIVSPPIPSALTTIHTLLGRIGDHPYVGHEDEIWSVAFSPDGTTLASSSSDSTIRIWSSADPSTDPIALRGYEDEIWSVAFSPDGTTLASGSSDSTIRIWSLADLSADPVVLRGHEDDVWSVAFSPDGTTLASGSSDSTIRIWSPADLSADPVVLRGHEAAVLSVAFSPDGTTLASGSLDRTIRIWSLADLSADPIVLSGRKDAIRSVAFSPDGTTLASGSGDYLSAGRRDGTIRLWSLADLSADPVVLRGHEAAVLSVVFSPDGTTLASGSSDSTIRIWSLADLSADPIVLRGHKDDVWSVAFSPDGTTLASGSWDSTIRLWRGSVTATLALACTTAGRNLRQDEWQRYFPEEPYRRTCPQWPAGQ